MTVIMRAYPSEIEVRSNPIPTYPSAEAFRDLLNKSAMVLTSPDAYREAVDLQL